jgi:hypothetical protein
MAENKETEIIFEYPEDLDNTESQNTTNDTEVDIKVKQSEEKISKPAEIDIEIEDDTPEEDRGREPLPKEVVEELEKDELTDYSTRVKERMAQLKKVWHDERRVKEAAEREREEAINYAKKVSEENKKLKSTLSSGEQDYINAIKAAVTHELEVAKRDYREAYDSGETDRIIEAQQKMNDAQLRLSQANNYAPQYNSTGQEDKDSVYIQPSQPQSFKPDQKAIKWQETNKWFGTDEEMTSLALGLHEKLVRSGIDPTSDNYYRRIDDTMRKRFPEYFGDATLDEETPAPRTTKPSTVVAPATRSTAPKKVRLSKTQLSLAKKFGLTPEQYALETLKLERTNG